MLKQSLALIGLTLTLSANAATLVVSGGQLMGATGVDVDGIEYDVSFEDGSCNDLFDGCTSFAFTTASEAGSATVALLSQVLIGIYDVSPELVNGISNAFSGTVHTPFQTHTGGTIVVTGAAVNANTVIDVGLLQDVAAGFDLSTDPMKTYALWTPAEVPLPAAAWLFMSAIAGLAGVKRISRSRRSV